MEILLHTPRLVLRDFTADDAEALLELDSDPQVMRFISNGAPTPREDIDNEVLPAFLGYRQSTPGFGF